MSPAAAGPRRGRLVAAALAALVGLLVFSETMAARERADPDDVVVDRDVARARAALAEGLRALEARCARAAERAVERTAGLRDPTALFTALEDIPLAEGAGIVLEDSAGRVLAWAGRTVDDEALRAMRRDRESTFVAATAASQRIAVGRRARNASPDPGTPAIAICHAPFEESFRLREREAASTGLVPEILRSYRVAEEGGVLPPDAETGEPLRIDGDVIARLDVRPRDATAWNEAVEAAAAARRSAILGALVLLAAGVAWAGASRVGRRRRRHLLGAAIVLAARVALGFVPLTNLPDLGAAADAGRYAHPLPVDLAGSPVSIALTCAAACVAAACLRAAARAAPLSPGGFARRLACAAAVALACRAGLGLLATDLVQNSRVEFFPAESVLPGPVPALLLGALVAGGVAAVFLVEAAWDLFPSADGRTGRALIAAASLGLLLAPVSAETPHAVALALVSVAGFAAAVGSGFVRAGVAVRAAAIPLGVALGVFAPLEAQTREAVRSDVAREAADRVSRTAVLERIFVADTLEKAASSGALLEALRRGRLPRDLALRLWSHTRLGSRAVGSSIEILPLAGFGDPQSFSADLPPASWLPDPASYPPPGSVAAQPLPGRGSGRDGLWIVGERRVHVDGRFAATLRILLEVRPPAPTLPELQVLRAGTTAGSREAPTLWVTRYSAQGALLDTDDPFRAAGATLDPALRRAAVEDRRELWQRVDLGDHELEVLVRPDVQEDAVVAVHAFTYDTGGAWPLVLRGTRAALCGALAALAALVATSRAWAGRVRLSLAQRLVLSYALVAALPLSVLAWANGRIASLRADETTRRDLVEAVALLRSALHDNPALRELAERPPEPGPVKDLRSVAYAIGHHANVFRGQRLVAASDRSLFETELLPTRLPGPVHRDVILLGRPFVQSVASVGGYVCDVGYAPWRSAAGGDVIGAVSVPLLHQRRLRERELASAVTAALGLYLATLVAAIGAGTWLARRTTRPLSDLTEAAKRVARGDLERPVPGAGPDELGEVVTAFNQMQRDLGESRARLVRAEKEAAWRDMARQVAHEVKNPLTPMRLAAEHIRRAWRDRAPQFDEVLQRSVDLIVRQTESLQRIATAFSDFARFPNRRREPVDLAKLLDDTLDLWKTSPGLSIERRIERPIPPVQADPEELGRVLVNLVKNATEALEGRAGTITASLERRDGALRLTLADDGPGIPPDVLPRLFEPYLSTKTKGTGLGLAICKRAIEDLGGTISVENRPAAGTTVTVVLPLPGDGTSSQSG